MDNYLVSIMLGRSGFGDWDAFLATCESLGLSQATAIMQQRYDAACKILG